MEGTVGDRFFPGSRPLDEIENLAESWVRTLFHLDDTYRVNIQPHSATQANQIVYNATLGPGDCVLSLDPRHGGHISHHVLIGRRNPVYHFGLNPEQDLDYRTIRALALRHRPTLIIAGASSYPRSFDFATLGQIAAEVGAALHADISHTALFAMTGHHSSPFPHADFVTFNPMKNLRGPAGGVIVYRADHHSRVRKAIFPDTQGGPLEPILFAKTVCFSCLLAMDLRTYAEAILANTRRFGDRLTQHGLRLVTGGSDMHFVLLDLREERITGVGLERRLEDSRILVNRNLIPDDPQSPRITSGVRIGLTNVTILEYRPEDIDELADVIAELCRGDVPDAAARVQRLTDIYHRALLSDASAARV